MTASSSMRDIGKGLTEADYLAVERRWVNRQIADAAGIRRVSSDEGRQLMGRRDHRDYAGLAIPYSLPGDSHVREFRLRRDAPDLECRNGSSPKERAKYLSPPGRSNMLYVAPGTTQEMFTDAELPVLITEGEFKCLALSRLAKHEAVRPRFLPIGFSGIWNWQGVTGKAPGPNGDRRDVRGTIPDLDLLVWDGRKVTIAFDADAANNKLVDIARASLSRELRTRGAKVASISWDIAQGKGIDDLLAAVGPEKVLALLDGAEFNTEAGWQVRLIRTDTGKRLPVVENALVALRSAPEWAGVLHFNESSLNPIAKIRPPWDDRREVPFAWTDEDDTRTAAWLQRQGILASTVTAGQAVQTVAREHPFHPIRQYLDALKWDGIRRLDDWLTLYIGVEPSDYVRAVAAKFPIGAVARVFKPGCKNDSCLILEGGQGILKSTALRTLFEPWFSDDMAELGTKDSALQTRGVWCIELSELDSMGRSEVSRIKAFMSRAVDRFRPPYGRRPIEAPRECVFAGTVNLSSYLRDETGARRFWPVRCGAINIPFLKRDRDQLWAEAHDRYQHGATWWLEDEQVLRSAADEQQQRYEGDPWDEVIEQWLPGHETVSVSEVLAACIDKPKQHWSQPDKNRVARCLRAAGWERFRVRDGDRLEWRYRRVK